MPKFSIEEHEKRMRELLTQKPLEGQRPTAFRALLDKAKRKIKKPVEVEEV